MAPRKYATWPNFSISARRPAGGLSARFGLRPPLVSTSACQPSPIERKCVRDAGGQAEVYLSVIPARAGIHSGTCSAPNHLGTVLVRAFTSGLFATEGVHHQLEVL